MPPRVLIVDDDATIREALQLLLDGPYEAVTAPGGRSALAILEGSRVDVVVLDLRMPEMSGNEVVHEMRARGLDVPIILMSAHADVTNEAAELGISHFLSKPFDITALEAMLEELLGVA